MELGLCMMVRNEANRIAGCLADIRDLFEDIVVVDTGSTDGTRRILENRFAIRPVALDLAGRDDCEYSAVRNKGLSMVKTPWVLSLDADERMARSELVKLIEMEDDPEVSGYFCAWNTYINGATIEDYKLSIFRKGLRKAGHIHENIQFDVRTRGLRAAWLYGVAISHFPDPGKAALKARSYRQRLLDAVAAEPEWYRYYWFLGYMYFRQDRLEEAVTYLSVAADSESPAFPVECLNSKMILAQIHAHAGRRREARETLIAARAFHDQVADDFEVQVNFRLRPWIEDALDCCRRGELGRIRAYAFAY